KAQSPQSKLVTGLVCVDVEAVLEERRAFGDRARQLRESVATAGWKPDRQSAAGRASPGHQVAQRGEVDRVVRVQVADHDGIERQGVARASEAGDRALPGVKEDGGSPMLHEEA